MNELFFAYALGAFLGGVTVFSILYPIVLNLKQDLFIRERQLNLYTTSVKQEKRRGDLE